MMRQSLVLTAFLAAALAPFGAFAQSTTAIPLPAPIVLRAPAPGTAARATTASGDSRTLAQGQFFVPARTLAERSSLLDQVTRERYREAMALNAARGTGTPIAFKKAKF